MIVGSRVVKVVDLLKNGLARPKFEALMSLPDNIHIMTSNLPYTTAKYFIDLRRLCCKYSSN